METVAIAFEQEERKFGLARYHRMDRIACMNALTGVLSGWEHQMYR